MFPILIQSCIQSLFPILTNPIPIVILSSPQLFTSLIIEGENALSKRESVLFFTFPRNARRLADRKDASKEGDETIVNHFHEVSSSSEAHRDVCVQTDPGSWILLDRAHVK
jgi:hypothetical protein